MADRSFRFEFGFILLIIPFNSKFVSGYSAIVCWCIGRLYVGSAGGIFCNNSWPMLQKYLFKESTMIFGSCMISQFDSVIELISQLVLGLLCMISLKQLQSWRGFVMFLFRRFVLKLRLSALFFDVENSQYSLY